MEIKRCVRCGVFFETVNEVCNGCITKDIKDMGKLKNFLAGYSYNEKVLTKSELSSGTGITMKNLNRFLSAQEFSGIDIADNVNISNEVDIEKKMKDKKAQA